MSFYSPVAMVKYPDKGNLREKGHTWTYSSRGTQPISDREKHGSWEGRRGGISMKLAGHFAFVLRKRRMNKKWGQGLKPQVLPQEMHLLQ